ncbi:hypothetical protein [uncultured Hymenobacter sp.]|uniref:hypothetical protein n=1 Tax=uncultured Hymenobacter sp. TaxID=170016 RepID=UPI0035CBD988
MYRPAFTPKLRINYLQTWQQLTRFFRNPAPIRPAAPPVHLAEHLGSPLKAGNPGLKGNVLHTMKEILTIFLAQWRQAPRPINLAIQTTRSSLAKRCQNLDPKTAYRHILTLIEHGFLRGKVHVRGGLQLLLCPDLIVFDAVPAVVQAAGLASRPAQAPELPLVTPEQGLAALRALAQNFANLGRRPT